MLEEAEISPTAPMQIQQLDPAQLALWISAAPEPQRSALALFYLWPAQGPYYLCVEHFSRFPAWLQAYSIQKALIAHARVWSPVANTFTRPVNLEIDLA